MVYSINATRADLISTSDLLLYDEISYIKRAILTESQAGNRQVIVNDGTVMTESSPEVTVTGTVTAPVITPSNTLILNDSAVVLGTTGTNLNAVIADINDAAISGVTATKQQDQLVLTYIPTDGVWQFVIGAGTANAELGLTTSTVTPTNPLSVDYYSVWRGLAQDRVLSDRMTTVIQSIEAKGFNIIRRTNTVTNTTFEWYIQW